MDNNMLESVKRFFRNKNTVTIIGVIAILVLLYIGYSVQINKAIDPVYVPVATQTIQPRTLITQDMVKTINMPATTITDNIYTSSAAVIGKYSNVNSVIPKGSLFYRETVVTLDDLPDAAFTKVKKGEVVYNFRVNMESTYGNSIFPGNKIDIYMKVGNGTDEKVMIGKLIENIEVLAVKDSSGRSVFENTSENRTPAMIIFGLSEELNLLLRKASYLTSLGVELYPVPHAGSVDDSDSTGATQVSTQELRDYIDAHSVNIQVAETQNVTETDALVPTFSETGGTNNKVTITYPEGCGSTYTCNYVKDSEKAVAVTSTKATVPFKANGKLTATVIEKDGTAHTGSTNIPISSSNAGTNG